MRTRQMAHLTWEEVRDAIDNDPGVILPIGATEQHGLHLPLDTDSVLPTKMGLAVADDTNMLVAPAVCYGYRSRPGSGGGQTFPGTTSVSANTLMSLISDILYEFVRSGFRRIVLLNWHMENCNFVYEAAFLVSDSLKKEYPDLKILVLENAFDDLTQETMDKIFEGQFPTWAIEHASIFETSLMLHVSPETVQFDKAVDDKAERYPYYDVLPIQKDMVAPSGTLWKATMASAEKGALGWKEVQKQITEAIKKELC